MKHCNTCNQDKELTEFYIAKTSKDGYSSQCKECIKARQTRYNAIHKEEQKIRDAEYRKNNLSKIKEREQSPERQAYLKNYRESHKDSDSQWHKEYYQQNKEDILIRQREYYQQNKEKKKQYYNNNVEKIKQYQKEYRLNNIDYIKEYDKQRRNNNKLGVTMSYQIWRSLHNVKAERHWEDLVSYSLEQLKEHLESQFTSEMNWDNYTREGWHIDHVIPQDVFLPFESESDIKFKICWSLANLRPLWYTDNLSRPRNEGTDIDDKVKFDIISEALGVNLSDAENIWKQILSDYYKKVGYIHE